MGQDVDQLSVGTIWRVVCIAAMLSHGWVTRLDCDCLFGSLGASSRYLRNDVEMNETKGTVQDVVPLLKLTCGACGTSTCFGFPH